MEKSRGIYISLLLLLVACTTTVNTKEYMQYLANPENGLVKQKAANGVKIKVKYLPVAYLVSREVGENKLSKAAMDSIKATYANSFTFMMTMGPDENKTFDITKVGVANYEEFAQRLEVMNFQMSEFVKLKVGEKELKPALMQMQSIYGLERKRDILFVFSIDNIQKENIEDIQFSYDDKLFYTGMNHFKFRAKDMNAIPKLESIG